MRRRKHSKFLPNGISSLDTQRRVLAGQEPVEPGGLPPEVRAAQLRHGSETAGADRGQYLSPLETRPNEEGPPTCLSALPRNHASCRKSKQSNLAKGSK